MSSKNSFTLHIGLNAGHFKVAFGDAKDEQRFQKAYSSLHPEQASAIVQDLKNYVRSVAETVQGEGSFNLARRVGTEPNDGTTTFYEAGMKDLETSLNSDDQFPSLRFSASCNGGFRKYDISHWSWLNLNTMQVTVTVVDQAWEDSLLESLSSWQLV